MFKIQFKSYSLNMKDDDDQTMNEAIQTIYSFDEKVIFEWGGEGEKIELYMKYDIGDSWPDILNMLVNLKDDSCFDFFMEWPSESFMALWEFKKLDSKNITINPTWSQTKKDSITVNRQLFIEEWEKLKKKVEDDLLHQGYNLDAIKNS